MDTFFLPPLLIFLTFSAAITILFFVILCCLKKKERDQTDVDMTSPLIYQANNPYNNGINYQQYTNQQHNTFQVHEQGYNPYQYQYQQASFNQVASVVPYQQAYPLQNHQIEEPPFKPPPIMPDENSK